jgi:hypothetical protein
MHEIRTYKWQVVLYQSAYRKDYHHILRKDEETDMRVIRYQCAYRKDKGEDESKGH